MSEESTGYAGEIPPMSELTTKPTHEDETPGGGERFRDPPAASKYLLPTTSLDVIDGVEGKGLGKRPAINDARTLRFSRFAQVDKIPKRYNPWGKRAPFQPRTFGNRFHGCCVRASQALHALRLERIETRATPKITDAELLRVYYDMTARRYGGGDTGAYELDGLNEWRNPDLTFRDTQGRPLTIDAFTSVDHRNHDELRAAIALAGRFGLKLCFALPRAVLRGEFDPPQVWDVPRDGEGKRLPLVGDWEPYSGGGHSQYADRYDEVGVTMVQSWYEGLGLPKESWPTDEQLYTWDFIAAYCDEAYWVVDSLDQWRQKKTDAGFQKLKADVDLAGIVKAVNKVSRTKVGKKRSA
jgi:hypothetical protein